MIDIDKLHPDIRTRAFNFIQIAKAHGIDLRIIFGIRTFEEQNALYNQEHDGIDNDGNGKIDDRSEHVTNAKAGQSFHNYGLAIDVVPFVDVEVTVLKDGKHVKQVVKKPDWNTKLWPKISAIGKGLGFAWGGDWRTFKDLPHFEYPPNTSWKQLMHLKEIGHVDKDGYVILT